MRKSRTVNSIFNVVTGIGGQLLTIILHFVSRTVFIYALGKEYLGISSLFTNILSMLSLAELGVGSAMVFKLYEPLALDDRKRVVVLMKFYKHAYTAVAIVIAILGLCLIPFLPYLISDYESLAALNINGVLIFLLYLLNTVASYLFFAYKSAIVKADQKEYILNIVSLVFILIQNILQITVLIVLHDFVAYVLVTIICSIAQNCVCAIIANIRYPYIKEKTNDRLSGEETKGIVKDCSALFLYKINAVVIKSTDNIVLSMFMGLNTVALYSNYYIFYTTINTLYVKIFDGTVHSLGNFHSLHSDDRQREYKLFSAIMLIAAALGSVVFVGIFVVADEFIAVWVGSDWVISQPFSWLLGFELFTLALQTSLARFRNAFGLFRQAKYRPIFSMAINIIVSVALVNYLGVVGVLIGTIISEWTTTMMYDPRIILTYGLGKKDKIGRFYFKLLKYALTALAVGILDKYLCSVLFVWGNWLSVMLHAGICVLTVAISIVLTNMHTDEFAYLMQVVNRYIHRIKK
ncbi:MAG: hypothetical protein LUH51_03525 [Firmicutes bacterium]|nr:hypothetical protein [Bacillota bacterium]